MTAITNPLADLRREAGRMTQLELATRIGVTPGMVSQWERGLASPRYEHARVADEALNANGRVLEAFGYMPVGTLTRLDDAEAAIERVWQNQMTAIPTGESALAELRERIARLERQLGSGAGANDS